MAEKGRQLLDVLMGYRREWATKCVYCGRTVVNMRLMPAEYAPHHYGGLDKVRFTINGRDHIAFAVTADHYFERCRGGHSELNNILPACRPCNNFRSHGREIPKCIDCLINRRTHGKRCADCRRAMDLKGLENDEWQRWKGQLYRALRTVLT